MYLSIHLSIRVHVPVDGEALPGLRQEIKARVRRLPSTPGTVHKLYSRGSLHKLYSTVTYYKLFSRGSLHKLNSTVT